MESVTGSNEDMTGWGPEKEIAHQVTMAYRVFASGSTYSIRPVHMTRPSWQLNVCKHLHTFVEEGVLLLKEWRIDTRIYAPAEGTKEYWKAVLAMSKI